MTEVPPPGDGTVGKALGVLDRVASFGRPTRLAELQTVCGLPKATLYRLLQTLVSQGMLTHDPETQTYALGVRLVRLAHAAWTQSSLAPLARSHLDRLSAETGETVHLAQLDGAHVLYVDKRNAKRPVDMFSQAGRVGPAYCTGVGKAMLAYAGAAELDRVLPQQSFHRFTQTTITDEATLRQELVQIHADGYAFDREEHEPGITCVAVPVLSPRGRLLGGLSLTGALTRCTLEGLTAELPKLTAAAQAIAEDVAAWRFPEAAPASLATSEDPNGRS
ncbi:MAG: IclR family transcriptional regulator [Rhodobacteraceae bacterium]|nr:IclR family transcriptional regulator [Paracoccaceae bacterium]